VQIWFFGLPTEIWGIWGILIYRWQGLESTLPTVYYTPQNSQKLQLQNKNENFVVV
jgi:hypothetical protein